MVEPARAGALSEAGEFSGPCSVEAPRVGTGEKKAAARARTSFPQQYRGQAVPVVSVPSDWRNQSVSGRVACLKARPVKA
jgi:hypothetical protein